MMTVVTDVPAFAATPAVISMQECGDSDKIIYGTIQVNPATHTVLLDGEPVHLAKVVLRQDIMSAVWGAPPNLKSRTLDIHICTLRKKLFLSKDLETVTKVGYRLRSHKMLPP